MYTPCGVGCIISGGQGVGMAGVVTAAVVGRGEPVPAGIKAQLFDLHFVAGVALHGPEVVALYLINKAHMAALKIEVTGLGKLFIGGEGLAEAKVAGLGNTLPADDAVGHACLGSTPADKPAAPVGVGVAEVLAVLGIALAAFLVAHLGQRHLDNIVALVAGVFMGIFISRADRHRHRSQEQRQGQAQR